ncbi:MAG: methyltransferase [Proteobacteria bacterium]|nr:MAG: methyltransferase [Pseudomonadota bacterium]
MMKEKVKLTGIPKTLLIPLRARYLETKKQNGIIDDPKTVEILDQIEYDFTGENKNDVSVGSQLGVAIRTEILDEGVGKFIEKNPHGVVVNLGCGLDTRFHRIDNGSVFWYDLDVPEAIELRKKFFDETDRFKFISKSVTDFSWLELLPKDKPILFVAEGLFMYFEESEIREIFAKIREVYPSSEVLFEAMSPYMAKNTEKHPDMKGHSAKFKWGIKTGSDLEDWNQGINFIEEWYYFDRHREKHPFIFKLLSLIPAFRTGMKIVHISFNKTT